MPSPDPNNVEPRNKGQAARLASLVASGRTLKAAAAELGIPYKRAKAWNRNPRFRARIDALQTEMADQTTAVLVAASTAAVGKLINLMRGSDDESIQLRAAIAILDRRPQPAAVAQAVAVAMDPAAADRVLKALVGGEGGDGPSD